MGHSRWDTVGGAGSRVSSNQSVVASIDLDAEEAETVRERVAGLNALVG